ncbi:MAG: hypothetical protein D6731_00515 [Planctomycetota bacterium]|nr:MAG: hypothetical protein D6731_00515 [Planctomycetota bacterium]
MQPSNSHFDACQALRDLDRRTPAYYLQEIFHHGDQTVRRQAIEALRELDPERRSVRVLREILKIV